MMLALSRAETDEEGWGHVTRFSHVDGVDLGVVNGDYTYLKHWGLLEPQLKTNGEPASGIWRLTDLGKRFIRGEVEVPRIVYLVNDILVEVSEEKTDVIKSLGDHFNYRELIGWSQKDDDPKYFLRMYAEYNEYHKSVPWKKRRTDVWNRANGICERCLQHQMDVTHHLTYENIYHEPLVDLWGLCNGCHEYVHGKSSHDPDSSGYWAGLEAKTGRKLTAREINLYCEARANANHSSQHP